MDTFYWHDYETWGADPSQDRPSQFAGVRTDSELNIVGEPLMLYCRPTPDQLPHPEACLVTGITPQQALAEGVSESQFIARIHSELAYPKTCGVGYNSIRFDDEVTRYTLYRNFYDPYAREWQKGNSRWDLIDLVRCCAAFRPEGIEWPIREDGTPSFKLELLTKANGLGHESAHDALSDVYATIAVAKMIKERQPRLFDYALSMRKKQQAAQFLDTVKREPILHVSGRIPASRYCTTMMMPLAPHPTNRNAVICYDLSVDPSPMLELSSEEIAERLFVSQDQLPDGVARIPLKLVHINRSPMVMTTKLLDDCVAERIQLDPSACWRHHQQIVSGGDLTEKLQQLFAEPQGRNERDPDSALYSGGFFSDHDRSLMDRVRQLDGPALAEQTFPFEDARLPELLFRYRARNFNKTLSSAEQAQWQEFCHERIHAQSAEGGLNLAQLDQRIAELMSDASERDQQILQQLSEYAHSL